MEQNIQLNDLMFKALDHGVDSIRGGGALVPFVMTETGLHRFPATTLEEGKIQAENYLISLTNEPVLAIVYDGFLNIENIKYDAIFVKAFDKRQDKGILIAQKYTPKRFLRSFKILGNPAAVEYPKNPFVV